MILGNKKLDFVRTARDVMADKFNFLNNFDRNLKFFRKVVCLTLDAKVAVAVLGFPHFSIYYYSLHHLFQADVA